jgi:imidazolonepropionase-like amidohydrolase
LDDAAVLALATRLEGHPDNVAPCLLGGGTLCWFQAGQVEVATVGLHDDLTAVALVSARPLSTKLARKALPAQVPFEVAARTAGRAALLASALAGDFDLLLPATEDVLHQPARLALDAGAALAFGSDFPVEDVDPRAGIRAAVTRKPAAGPVWMPEQRLRRDEALHAFTAGAAWAEFAEARRGRIREGFDADLTVFRRDVMAVHADELCSVPVAATVVGGRVVYAGD